MTSRFIINELILDALSGSINHHRINYTKCIKELESHFKLVKIYRRDWNLTEPDRKPDHIERQYYCPSPKISYPLVDILWDNFDRKSMSN